MVSPKQRIPGHWYIALLRIAAHRHKDGEVGEGDHLSRAPFHDFRI